MGHHDNCTITDRKPAAIAFEVDADSVVVRDPRALIQDGAAHYRTLPDMGAGQQDGVSDDG